MTVIVCVRRRECLKEEGRRKSFERGKERGGDSRFSACFDPKKESLVDLKALAYCLRIQISISSHSQSDISNFTFPFSLSDLWLVSRRSSLQVQPLSPSGSTSRPDKARKNSGQWIYAAFYHVF